MIKEFKNMTLRQVAATINKLSKENSFKVIRMWASGEKKNTINVEVKDWKK